MTTLNRRGFLQSLVALGAVPLLPVVPVAAASASATYTPMQMLWATYYAQMNNACSPAQITKALGVSPDVAQNLYRGLLDKGVLTPSLSGGPARARHPMADGMTGHRPSQHRLRAPYRPINQDWIMAQVTRDIPHQLPFFAA